MPAMNNGMHMAGGMQMAGGMPMTGVYPMMPMGASMPMAGNMQMMPMAGPTPMMGGGMPMNSGMPMTGGMQMPMNYSAPVNYGYGVPAASNAGYGYPAVPYSAYMNPYSTGSETMTQTGAPGMATGAPGIYGAIYGDKTGYTPYDTTPYGYRGVGLGSSYPVGPSEQGFKIDGVYLMSANAGRPLVSQQQQTIMSARPVANTTQQFSTNQTSSTSYLSRPPSTPDLNQFITTNNQQYSAQVPQTSYSTSTQQFSTPSGSGVPMSYTTVTTGAPQTYSTQTQNIVPSTTGGVNQSVISSGPITSSSTSTTTRRF